MESKSNIPQKIWETDCKYCIFRGKEENTKNSKYDCPCRLNEYEDRYKVFVNGKWISGNTYNKDHCHSFKPVEHFGLCSRCKYFNRFMDKVAYCTHRDRPHNRRNVYPDITPDGYADCWNYTRCTCDRYEVAEDWKRILLLEALAGRIPKNFNPETWEATEHIDGKTIEWEFAISDYEYEQRVKEREARIKEDEQIVIKKSKKDYDGQINLNDIFNMTGSSIGD